MRMRTDIKKEIIDKYPEEVDLHELNLSIQGLRESNIKGSRTDRKN